MVLVTSTLIFVYGGESVEERWLEREQLWKEQEVEWESEIHLLEKQKEQLELVLSKHFIDHNKLHILQYTQSDSHAIVTVFGTDKEEQSPAWVNALILFQSLKETKCRVPNKVALSWQALDTIPEVAKNAFRRLGVDLRYVGDRPGTVHSEDWSKNEWKTQTCRLINFFFVGKAWLRSKVFQLSEFSHILFMDAESIAVDNIDHVFDIPVPSDHKGEENRLIFTALNQDNCEHYNSCNDRRAPSARFFMIKPNVSYLTVIIETQKLFTN